MDNLLSVAEAALAIRKSEKTLYRHYKDGKISAEKDINSKLRFEPSELVRVYGELQKVGGQDSVSKDTEYLTKYINNLEQQIEILQKDKVQLVEEKKLLYKMLEDDRRLLLTKAERGSTIWGSWLKGWTRKTVKEEAT